MISSYPQVYNLGHAAIMDIFDDPVAVQEKVDGSQFSWRLGEDGLEMRSKGAVIHPEAPPAMFREAVETVKALGEQLVPGLTYRGEALQKPKHNTLCYGRVPRGNVILFDIDAGLEEYLAPVELRDRAMLLGLEVVPLLHNGKVNSWEELKGLLDRESVLGGTSIEGMVFKNYARFTRDKKAMMGKYVSEAFKERHGKEWRSSNPTGKDLVGGLILQLRTEARWRKAIQHLRERGELQGAPQDIGPLIKEVVADVLKEEREYIIERLFKYAWKQIGRGVIHGLPEFYKDELAKTVFTPEPNVAEVVVD